jgi:CRP/FNR family cyclic AMP-dependent transcriptional regulator
MEAATTPQDASGASAEFLHELAKLGETRTWEAGATVVSQGEPADCMYVIHEGELRVLIAGEGGRVVELNTLRAGDLIGELILSGEVRSATVQATTRARLTRVTRAEVERLLSARPDLAFLLVQRLVERVRGLTRTVGLLASSDVYGRLVGLFEALAVEARGERFVPGPMSQQRIAERVGASKAMVNRLLQDLERGGYITATRERIVLLKKLPPKW